MPGFFFAPILRTSSYASPGLVRTDNSHLIAGNLLPGELLHPNRYGRSCVSSNPVSGVRPCVPVCSGFLLRSGFLPCSVFCSAPVTCSAPAFCRSGHLSAPLSRSVPSPWLHQCKVSLRGHSAYTSFPAPLAPTSAERGPRIAGSTLTSPSTSQAFPW